MSELAKRVSADVVCIALIGAMLYTIDSIYTEMSAAEDKKESVHCEYVGQMLGKKTRYSPGDGCYVQLNPGDPYWHHVELGSSSKTFNVEVEK